MVATRTVIKSVTHFASEQLLFTPSLRTSDGRTSADRFGSSGDDETNRRQCIRFNINVVFAAGLGLVTCKDISPTCTSVPVHY